jgi:transcriptional regulator with XRE-family HTH domain
VAAADDFTGVNRLPELIQRVLDERGWNPSTLARRCGIANSTLHSWISGDRATGSRGPSDEKLRLLAEGAGLTLSEVYEAAGRRTPAPQLTEEEAAAINVFRALDDHGRHVAMVTMRALANRHNPPAADGAA